MVTFWDLGLGEGVEAFGAVAAGRSFESGA
jgi:hypothetical protein